MAACKRYLEFAPRDFITFEYCMLDGVNDTDLHARELIALVKDVPCKFNLIPFNPFPESGLKRSNNVRIKAFSQILLDAGLVTTIRKPGEMISMPPVVSWRGMFVTARGFRSECRKWLSTRLNLVLISGKLWRYPLETNTCWNADVFDLSVCNIFIFGLRNKGATGC
jgi:hypothetical protein